MNLVLTCLNLWASGLGKTLQSISFLAWLRENRGIRGPHLVIAPLNVLDTWLQEIHRWCPSMRAVRYHGSDKEKKRIHEEQLKHGQSTSPEELGATLLALSAIIAHRSCA